MINGLMRELNGKLEWDIPLGFGCMHGQHKKFDEFIPQTIPKFGTKKGSYMKDGCLE